MCRDQPLHRRQRLADIRRSLGARPAADAAVHRLLQGRVRRAASSSTAVDKVQCTAPCLGYSFRTGRAGQGRDLLPLPDHRCPRRSVRCGRLPDHRCHRHRHLRRPQTRHRDRPLGGRRLAQVLGSIPYYVLALLSRCTSMILRPILPEQYTPLFTDGPAPGRPGSSRPGSCWASSRPPPTPATPALHDRDALEDYIRTARSKGISERRVVYRHGLRAAISPDRDDPGPRHRRAADRDADHRADLRGRRDRPSLALRCAQQTTTCRSSWATVLVGAMVVVMHEPRRRHRVLLHRPASEAVMTDPADGAIRRPVRRTAATAGDVVLEVRDLSVAFPTDEGVVDAVLRSQLRRAARAHAGRSSVSPVRASPSRAWPCSACTTRSARMITGSIRLDGQEIVGRLAGDAARRSAAPRRRWSSRTRSPRCTRSTRIGNQIAEAYRAHHQVSKAASRRSVPSRCSTWSASRTRDRRASQYPHEFSGGMRQRAMIALGLVNNPKLLIADEPTTALDVTVQAQILDLVNDLQQEFGSAVVLITHDLAVVAEIADDILVMYAGRGVEKGRRQGGARTAARTPTPGACSSRMPSALARTSTGCSAIRARRPACSTCPTGCSFHPRCEFKTAGRGRRAASPSCPSSPPTPGLASTALPVATSRSRGRALPERRGIQP